MKKIKTIFIILILMLLIPSIAKASSIHFGNTVKISETVYQFTLTVEDMKLNAISGDISVTNGKISKITMHSSWLNQTGTSNNFYFYRNGPATGNYTVATVEVVITGNSVYDIKNLEYTLNKCKTDKYNNYYGETGLLVSKTEYDKTCSISKDAYLKTLSSPNGELSPTFTPTLELYTMAVSNNTDSVTWNAIPNDTKSEVISGLTCPIKAGLNLCKIVVQAESGNTKTYTITITRKNSSGIFLSNDASIRDLKVHGGTLTKTFKSDVTTYDLKPDKNSNSVYFTFTVNSNDQQLTSNPCTINEATKTCKLIVTAEDGVSKKSYLFNILQENNGNTTNKVTPTEDKVTSVIVPTKKPTSPAPKPNKDESTSSKNENNNNVSVETDDDTTIEKNENIEIPSKNQEYKPKGTIKLPYIGIEVEKSTFFMVATIINFFIGVTLGTLITKYRRKRMFKNEKMVI